MQTWDEVREAVRGLSAALDPSRITIGDAQRLLTDLSAIKNMTAAAEARVAARVAEGELWRINGAKGPAEDLARRSGISVAEAKSVLETGRALEELPAVRRAAQRGQLSAAQAAVIADAALAVPEVAADLLHTARSGSWRELRDAALTAKAAADSDPEATRRRIHRARGMWTRRDADGAKVLTWRDNPERIDQAVAELASFRERLFKAARRAGRKERSDALDADALHAALTAQPSTASAADVEDERRPDRWRAAQVIVRVDAAAAERGHPTQGELCEIAGSGPVALSAVREMIAGGASLAVVQTRGTAVPTVAHMPRRAAPSVDIADPNVLDQVLTRYGRPAAGVVHKGRKPTAHQVTALLWISPTCSAQGCSNLRCQIDHRTGWAVTRTTRLEDLDRLCSFHHDLKTHHGWRLVDGTGKRPFVPQQRRPELARAP